MHHIFDETFRSLSTSLSLTLKLCLFTTIAGAVAATVADVTVRMEADKASVDEM